MKNIKVPLKEVEFWQKWSKCLKMAILVNCIKCPNDNGGQWGGVGIQKYKSNITTGILEAQKMAVLKGKCPYIQEPDR